MREIKFRAWDKQLRRMCDLDETNTFAIFGDEYFEVMQFTGLKDKNGKEIYESDIVRFQHHKPSVCVWSGWGWGWEVNTPKGKRVYESGVGQFKQDEFDADYRLNNAEIIGNIYSNPELKK